MCWAALELRPALATGSVGGPSVSKLAACPNVVGVQLDVSANERLLVFLEEIDGFSEVLVRRGW